MLTKNPETLIDWLAVIEKNHPPVINLGLERVIQVASKGNLLNFKCPVVTIAGTNGKGSTLCALAKLVEKSGIRYGTYTSPHILHFQERIRINGECIEEAELCEAFRIVASLSEGVALTYFEFTTLAALYIFQQAKLELLILEIGLGGRLDAVNVVSPTLAILTSISFDHQEYLGHTLSEIAKEKAGILRSGIPLVLSHEAALPVILEEAKNHNNLVLIEGKDFHNDSHATFKIPCHYLPSNSVSLAMAAYTMLRQQLEKLPSISEAVTNLENVGMVGRFQPLSLSCGRYIFDVAHNPGGAAWLAKRLKERHTTRRYVAVWSSFADKNLAEIIKPLVEIIDTWYVCPLKNTSRTATQTALATVLTEHQAKKIFCFNTVEDALQAAQASVSSDDEIVVFGSFYTVAQAFQFLKLDKITLKNNGLYDG